MSTTMCCISDDIQLYVHFKVDNVTALGSAHFEVEACVTDIKTWMALHRLKLNDDKTEYVLILSSAVQPIYSNWRFQDNFKFCC